ncbi:primosomal protein N' [Sphaerisporangium sp. NPDC088356]|uniref:primosomal protein N' n=1 Tax=Sphaerisporangium sp. NPDC088356 TaxID=3154871 RepID=UPI003435894B
MTEASPLHDAGALPPLRATSGPATSHHPGRLIPVQAPALEFPTPVQAPTPASGARACDTRASDTRAAPAPAYGTTASAPAKGASGAAKGAPDPAKGVSGAAKGAPDPIYGIPATAKGTVAPAKGASSVAKGALVPAEVLPVARVLVDTPLPHLDRPFDYLVPEAMAASAVPGCRVRVRFAGKLVDGFLLERAGSSEHEGKLAGLERVVSPEPVLTPRVAALCRAVADRYAGTMSDVLRLAVPPRHARVEAEAAKRAASSPAETGEPARPAAPAAEEGTPGRTAEEAEQARPAPVRREGEVGEEGLGGQEAVGRGGVVPEVGAWGGYAMGASFLTALAEGRAPRAVWNVLPGTGGEGHPPEGPEWPEGIALAVRATLGGGRGAVVVMPDGKDVALLDAALRRVLGEGRHVALTADLGPAERYRRWLGVLRGQVRVAVGTRAAAFAPVPDLGLAVIWDDGDDLHAERLAPYPHAREVLALRAHQTGAAMLIAGYARTAEATQLIATGWARPIGPSREELRRHAPRVRPAGDDTDLARDEAARAARLPSVAWGALKQGLASGPVLVQVPRRGYLPALACQNCRAPARCAQSPGSAGFTGGPGEAGGSGGPLCGGPLALRGGHAAPYCRWCGRIAGTWRCQACGSNRMRAVVVGARRTAEELGRAFPSVPVKTSGRDGVLATVGQSPALVVATPGAEPVAEGGYAAAVLLDGWALLGRPDLRAAEETLRRWMNAAALLRPAAELVVLADSAVPAVQALLRWDPVTHAERELAERTLLGFPPAVRVATLTGSAGGVREMAVGLRLPEGAQVLGPVPIDRPRHAPGEPEERIVIRVPRGAGAALARTLKGAEGVRSARKAPDLVRVCMDPIDLI